MKSFTVPKAEVRAWGKAVRAGLDADTRATYDAQIVARCQAELDWSAFARVMVFLPMARQHEINIWPLIAWLYRTHPKLGVYAPRVDGEVMEAVHITAQTEYVLSDWGIPEPAAGSALDVTESVDMVLTPLLGFDAQGNRVGYGRGYYDRFFAQHPGALRVGLGYRAQFVRDVISAEPHDVRLHAVITQSGRMVF